MKRLVLSLSFISFLNTVVFADSNAEQMCQAAVMVLNIKVIIYTILI